MENVFVYLILHVIFTGIINLVWFKFFNVKPLNLKLPKHKKYKNKKSPIYKLTENYVQKYELNYYIIEWSCLFYLIILYPIDLYVWKYNWVGSYFIDKELKI